MEQVQNALYLAESISFADFQPPPPLVIRGHLPLHPVEMQGPEGFSDLRSHRSRIRLYLPPTHGLFKGHVPAVSPQLSMTHSKERVCPGKTSRLGGLARRRILPEASTIFQKEQWGFSENGRLQRVLSPFLSRQKQEATTS